MLENSYPIRTDLALESQERLQEDQADMRGIRVLEERRENGVIVSTVMIETENASVAMGRPKGTYITIEAPEMIEEDAGYHRDISLELAKIMFFNGLSRTTASGDIPYLKNPYISDNLAFSFQMQLAAAEYYPDFTRRIYLKGYRFNMHFCPKSMLVEVGAQTNTFEEAKNAMEPLADLFAKVLK